MPARSQLFRLAVRKFGPFEAAIAEQWASFCARRGCTLTLEAVPLDLHPLHDALFARGGLRSGAWDAAFVVTDWLAEAHATGALLDLAPHLARHAPEDYPDGWTPSLLRAQRYGGAVLGLPYHDGPECLVYRRDLFDAAGLSPPLTWAEFHARALILSEPDRDVWGTVFAGYPDGHNTVYDFCLQLWTRGAELMDETGRLLLDGPAAHEGLGFLRAMFNDRAAVHPRSREFDSVQSGFAFARGEVAMMVNWFGFAALGETLPESRVKGRVAIAPIPAGPGGASASLNVYWLLGVAAGSPHAAVAQEFLVHCASRANDKLLTLTGGIGCRRSTWHDPDVSRIIPFYPALERIHEGARELPRLPGWAALAGVIDRLVVAATSSNESIALLAARAQREADALIGTRVPKR